MSRRGAVVATTVVLTAALFVAYAYFCTRYSSFVWWTDPPERMTVGGSVYIRSSLAPVDVLPADRQWSAKFHMWPLGYGIYWPRGDDVTTGSYLQWRDGLFYLYSLSGGP